MPVVKPNNKVEKAPVAQVEPKAAVPTVSDLAGSNKELVALRTECGEMIQFLATLPGAIRSNPKQLSVVIHDLESRTAKFAKVVG